MLATSDNLQGLVVQGNSITETIEIARDVAKKLIEAQEQQIVNLAKLSNSFNYPLFQIIQAICPKEHYEQF